MSKPYREYRTVTRWQALSAGFDGMYLLGGYDLRIARALFREYDWVDEIHFCSPVHNRPKTRYIPPDNTIIYLKSRYGRGPRMFVGENARVRDKDKVVEAVEPAPVAEYVYR